MAHEKGSTMVLVFGRIITILIAAALLSACAPASTPPPLVIQESKPVQATQSLPLPTIIPSPTSVILPTRTPAPFDGPLSVVISTPFDNQIVKSSTVEMIGQADPGTVITINDDIFLIDSIGTFHVELTLEPGLNLIEIMASDSENNQEFSYLTIDYETEP